MNIDISYYVIVYILVPLFFIVVHCFLWYFLNVRHLYTMSLILKSQIIIKNILKITFFFLIYKLILYPLNRFNYRYTDNYRNCWQQKKENIQYSVQIEHCSLAPPLMYRNMRETWFSVNIFLVYYDVTHSI